MEASLKRNIFLHTEHLNFSLWKLEDLVLARNLWGNPEVTRFISASGQFSAEEIQNRFQLEMNNQKRFGIAYWPIFMKKTDVFVGCCGLRPRDAISYEIGFHLLPEFWGEGLATEAAEAVINYAFRHYSIKKLFAGHNPKNIRSAVVLRKLGFRYIGDEFYAPTGLDHPSYEYIPDVNQ